MAVAGLMFFVLPQDGIVLGNSQCHIKPPYCFQKRLFKRIEIIAGMHETVIFCCRTAARRARCTLFLIGAVESGDVRDMVDACLVPGSEDAVCIGEAVSVGSQDGASAGF